MPEYIPPVVGDMVVRVKYPSKFLEAGKAYKVVLVQQDVSYTSEWKISLEGIEPPLGSAHRWFDPLFFDIVSGPQWVPGAKVLCHNPDNIHGWADVPDICVDGNIYTVKKVLSQSFSVEENPYLYMKKHFTLLTGNYTAPPKPKTIVYNKQG